MRVRYVRICRLMRRIIGSRSLFLRDICGRILVVGTSFSVDAALASLSFLRL
jgi:hypothetical protein